MPSILEDLRQALTPRPSGVGAITWALTLSACGLNTFGVTSNPTETGTNTSDSSGVTSKGSTSTPLNQTTGETTVGDSNTDGSVTTTGGNICNNYLFFEDFNAPAAGWELGPLWEIAPAAASPVGLTGADPSDDHGPSGDGALAGTLVGKLIPVGTHTATCLSSPPIDASAEDIVKLSFWRHLHADYLPFATHTIEVFDGLNWHELEKGYTAPGIDDGAWTFIEYDLSPFANDALRVRICHAQINDGIAHAGWSLDDFTVGPHACTPES